MTSSLTPANRIYDFSRVVKMIYYPIHHEPFKQFCVGLRRFLRLCGDSSGDDYWGDLIRTFRRFRFRVATTPIPFNHPNLGPLVDEKNLWALIERGEGAYPHLAPEARVLLELWGWLRACDDNPLLQQLKIQEAGDAEHVALVLPDTRMLIATEKILRSAGVSKQSGIIAPADLRGNACYDSLILLGGAQWFPDFLFSSPRAPVISVVAYRWFARRWSPRVTLLGTRAKTAPVEEPLPIDDLEIQSESLFPEIDWVEIERRGRGALGPDTKEETLDEVEARLFTLHGGYAVFLEAHEGATSLVIDPDHPLKSRVRRIRTDDIQLGMYILLRTEGGGDYIMPVADGILQQRAFAYRSAQREWKAELRKVVQREGLPRVAQRLRELGANRAEEGNIRHWMSERSIATHEKRDFSAVMNLIRLDEKAAERCWGMMRAIRAAHLRAGMAIRRRLLEQVRATDADRLAGEERIDFVLPEAEGGKLSGFRVEARAPMTAIIEVSRLNQVFTRAD